MKLERAADLLRLNLQELKADGAGAKSKVAKAFRDLSVEFHPDKNKNEGATEMYQNLTNANTKLIAYLTTGNDEDSDFSSDEEDESGDNKPVTFEFMKGLGLPITEEQFKQMFAGKKPPSTKEFLQTMMAQGPPGSFPSAAFGCGGGGGGSGAASPRSPASPQASSGKPRPPPTAPAAASPPPPVPGTPAAAALGGKLVGERVVVCGTSLPHLNGLHGKATGFDHGAGRYTVTFDEPAAPTPRGEPAATLRFKVQNVRAAPKLEADGSTPSLPLSWHPSGEECQGLCPLLGHHVTVVNTSRAAVNGEAGVVTGFDEASGRYIVELNSNVNKGIGLKLKPVNVERPPSPQEEVELSDDSDDDSFASVGEDNQNENGADGPPPLDDEDDDDMPSLDGDHDGEEEEKNAPTAAVNATTLPDGSRDWSAVSEASLPFGGDVMEAQRAQDRAAVKEIFAWRTWRESNPVAARAAAEKHRSEAAKKAAKKAQPATSKPVPAPAPKPAPKPAAKPAPKPAPKPAAKNQFGPDSDDDSDDSDDMPGLYVDDEMPGLEKDDEGDQGGGGADDDWVGGGGTGTGGGGAAGKNKKKNKKKKSKKKKGAASGGAAAAAEEEENDSDGGHDKEANEAAASATAAAAAAAEEAEAEAAASRKKNEDAEAEAREERVQYEKQKKEAEVAAKEQVAQAAQASKAQAEAEKESSAAELAKAKKARETEKQRRNFERKQQEQAAKEAKEQADAVRKEEKEAKRLAKKEERRVRKAAAAEQDEQKKDDAQEAGLVAQAIQASKKQAQADADSSEGFSVVGSKAFNKQQKQQQQQQQPAAPTPAAAAPQPPKQFGFEKVTSAPGAAELLWQCEMCTYHNQGLSLACELCQAPRPIEVTAVPPAYNPYEAPFVPSAADHAEAPLNGSQNAFDAGAYANPFFPPAAAAATTFSSTPSSNPAARPAAPRAPPPPQAPSGDEQEAAELWECLVCTFGNHPDFGVCGVCHSPRGRNTPTQAALDASAAVAASTAPQAAPPPASSKQQKKKKPAAAQGKANNSHHAPPPGFAAATPTPSTSTAAAAAAAVASSNGQEGTQEGAPGDGGEDKVVDGEWTEAELSERRVDENDGHFYTKDEFLEFYHTTKEWSKAKYASLCDFYTRGHCKDGEKCRFRHVKPNPVATAAAAAPPAPAVGIGVGGGGAGGAVSAQGWAPPPPPPMTSSPSFEAMLPAARPPGFGDSGWGSGVVGATPLPSSTTSSPSATAFSSALWGSGEWGGSSYSPPPPANSVAPPAAQSAAIGKDTDLSQVLAHLGCSPATAAILAEEEYDTSSLLQSTFEDFKGLSLAPADCNALASWVASVKLFGDDDM